ncbi:MAG: peptidylprolyl isomerase [Parcubacteria group bacterium]|jgi:cyclophilin family peptidyl-prolyl cis-trans isomerase
MKKTAVLIMSIFLVVILSACSQKEEKSKDAIPNPISDPAGYVPGMVDINKKAQEDIQNAVNSENEKLTNALNENNMNEQKTQFSLIKTSLGDIKIELSADSAPATVKNFSDLAKKGFYDGTKFHRVIKGFMIQAGDPLSKDDSQKSMWGTGGPGYKFKDELTGKEKYLQGTFAMANSGPNTNGSQFFIVTASPGAQLPPSYTVFGKVVSGMDVALKIENVKTAPNDQPVDDVVVYNMELMGK